MSKTLEQLAAEWVRNKHIENAANAARVAVEEQIILLTGKRDEGAETHQPTGFKVTVTGKVTRKMDWKAWETVKTQIPADLHPIKTKEELDEKGVKWLQENRSDLYALLPIEVKPAKTAVDIKAVEAAAELSTLLTNQEQA